MVEKVFETLSIDEVKNSDTMHGPSEEHCPLDRKLVCKLKLEFKMKSSIKATVKKIAKKSIKKAIKKVVKKQQKGELGFSPANSKLLVLERKLNKKLYSFSMLSGFNCPGAKDCQSFAEFNEATGKFSIRDGKYTEFRCFSASQEVRYRPVYNQRKKNQRVLIAAAKSAELAAQMILESIPDDAEIIRVHVAGDFKTQNYFDAWLIVAEKRPDLQIYCYTKSLPFWVKRIDKVNSLANFAITASVGGKYDELISKYNLRSATVVGSLEEAQGMGLLIDKDDAFAAEKNGKNFALLVFSTQPKNSRFAKIVTKRIRNGEGGYAQARKLERAAKKLEKVSA